MSKARTDNTAVCAGWHAVQAILERRPKAVQTVWLASGRDDLRSNRVVALAEQGGVLIRRCGRDELDKLASGIRHPGVVAQITPAQPGNINDLDNMLDAASGDLLLLVLDQVQDPHNLGALLRTADAAGVHALIVPADRSASLTPAARKAAAGAAETVPLFQVTNLARALQSLQQRGIWLHGLAGEAQSSIYQADLTGHVAVVLGAEGAGLRKRTRDLCDALWHLPMTGTVESLNVSASGAIALYEVVRQREALSL